MKVVITPFTIDAAGTKTYGTPFPITGLVPTEQVSDFDLSGRNEIEIKKAIRADGIEPLDRGNQQNALSFKISRVHADAGSAAHFLVQHAIDLPRVGRITLTFFNDLGVQIYVAYMNASAIIGYRGAFEGKSTQFAYQMTGGQLSNSIA